jgi:DNA-binding response OmpR family regulator
MTKILLVEDNEMNRDMLSRRLQRRGYEILLAADGAMGVSAAIAEQPDLILMDMSLPVMDGWEATRRLKADLATQSIPVIALTAHAMVGDRQKCLEAGCDDYDTKPVELPSLLQKIEALLAKRQPIAPTETGKEHTNAQCPMPQAAGRLSLSTHNSIEFPAAVNEKPPVPTPPPANTTQTTILLVDDNAENRDMLGRRLQRAGYQVIFAEDGEQGLKAIEQQAIAMVLLDIMMPGIGGLETLKLIRRTHSQTQLPVLMASAKDRSEDIVLAFELGANDYITKPIDFPVALARIQSQLSTIQAVRSQPVLRSAADNNSESDRQSSQSQDLRQTNEKTDIFTAEVPLQSPLNRLTSISPESVKATLSIPREKTPLLSPAPSFSIAQKSVSAEVQPLDLLLLNRYQVTKILLQDQFRQLYLARDTQQVSSANCVVEQLNFDVDRPNLWETVSSLFHSELGILKPLGESGKILNILNAIERDRHLYLVQEFLPGTLLAGEIQPGKRQSLRYVLDFLVNTLKILEVFHQHRLIHQAIDPTAIVRRQSDRQLVFFNSGLAARLTAAWQPKSQTNIYAAPEQKQGQPTFSSDIYAVGTMAIAALTGHSPDELPVDERTGIILWKHMVNVGDRFAHILDKMVCPHLEDRYVSISEVLSDIYNLPMVANLLQRQPLGV